MKKIDKKTEDFTRRYLDDFAAFEHQLNGQSDSALHQVRKNALNVFKQQGFPTRKSESWRYTDISAKTATEYLSALDSKNVQYGKSDAFHLAGEPAARVCLRNGILDTENSQLQNLPEGVVICSLQKAIEQYSQVTEAHLFKQAKVESNSLVALNTAFLAAGLFIYIPKNIDITSPIEIIHQNGVDNSRLHFHPRLLLVAGENSEITLLENFSGMTDGNYFRNMVSEISLGEHARMTHIHFQDESKSAFLIANNFVHQERNSTYTDLNLDLGGGLVRNEIHVDLAAENCESNLYGFYFAQNHQHIDNHTYMNHLKPNCNSNELYKGILNDSARSVFSGTILVEKDAQKTNAFQSNKNLLLSKNAEADSKPQLKIFADDVRCTHGATIGELDEMSLFYLQQRGISREQANSILRYAFASEVLECVINENLRAALESQITSRLQENF